MQIDDWVIDRRGRIGPVQVSDFNDLITEVRVGPTPGTCRTVAIPTADLRPFEPGEGQTVWIPISRGATWAQGNTIGERDGKWIIETSVSPNPLPLDPHLLWVRSYSEPADASHMLREGMTAAKGERRNRRNFRAWVNEQLACSGGYSAVLSAPVRPVQHQINALVRVMSDTVMRFILADEVGLGKTIEAGLVLRQYLHDDPSRLVIVATPSSLVKQWEAELRDKLRLGDWMNRDQLRVVPFEKLATVQDPSLLVIDEAHRICDETELDSQNFQHAERLARSAPSLLLLSATPLRGRVETFLRMLYLIDPRAYPLHDVEGFKSRLEMRAEQAQLLDLLGGELLESVLQEVLTALEAQLPKEHGLDAIFRNAREATDGARRRELLDQIRGAVEERFRVGRRVIRTRRSSVSNEDFPVPGRTIDVLSVSHSSGPLVDTFVEQWAELARMNSRTSPSVFSDLLGSALGGAHTLRTWVEARRSDLGSGAASAFASESALLGEFLVKKIGDEHHLGDVLAAIERQLAARGDAVVVATSSTHLATEALKLLQARFGERTVLGHLCSHEQSANLGALQAFESGQAARVLVIDSSAEEGCNLQMARQIINLDVPWSINRLEQRIGRLDRYSPGAARPALCTVAINSQSRLQVNFVSFLTEAVGVFERSVATMQRSLVAVSMALEQAVFERGVGALLENHEEVRRLIDDDERDSDLLEYLESSSAFGEFPNALFERLLKFDEDWGVGQKAIGGLTEKDGGYHIPRSPVLEDGSVHRYRTHQYTKLPLRLRTAIETVLPSRGTVSRPLALNNSHYELLRIGHPFVDLLATFVARDERGRVEIRHVHDPQTLSAEVRFEMEVGVNWSVETQFESLVPALRPNAIRRLSVLLSPRTILLTVNGDGASCEPVNDWFEAFASERLVGPRLVELLRHLPDWNSCNERVLGLVHEQVATQLAPEISSARVSLEASSSRRSRSMPADDVGGRSSEQAVLQCLLSAAEVPAIRIESIHVVIKSAAKV